jgi:hypothetical protein
VKVIHHKCASCRKVNHEPDMECVPAEIAEQFHSLIDMERGDYRLHRQRIIHDLWYCREHVPMMPRLSFGGWEPTCLGREEINKAKSAHRQARGENVQ